MSGRGLAKKPGPEGLQFEIKSMKPCQILEILPCPMLWEGILLSQSCSCKLHANWLTVCFSDWRCTSPLGAWDRGQGGTGHYRVITCILLKGQFSSIVENLFLSGRPSKLCMKFQKVILSFLPGSLGDGFSNPSWFWGASQKSYRSILAVCEITSINRIQFFKALKPSNTKTSTSILRYLWSIIIHVHFNVNRVQRLLHQRQDLVKGREGHYVRGSILESW